MIKLFQKYVVNDDFLDLVAEHFNVRNNQLSVDVDYPKVSFYHCFWHNPTIIIANKIIPHGFPCDVECVAVDDVYVTFCGSCRESSYKEAFYRVYDGGSRI